MELRQLTTDIERQLFDKCLTEARATRGAGFKETARSRLGKAHLAFGYLYALFENESDPPQRMLAGFGLHDLATLPQSYPIPDMSHLPAHSVLEGTELWSLSRGVAPIAASAAAAVAGILQAKAILVYPICKPFDLSAPYARFNFRPCEPVRFPYGQTNDGDEIWVRPMVLEGERLDEYIRSGFDFLFRGGPDREGLQFSIKSQARPSTQAQSGREHNGTASV
jgi:hypothetical protein